MSGHSVHCDYNVKTASTAPVISLDEVKNYLKVETTEDDDLIELLIDAAVCVFEAFTGQDLISREYFIACSGFPDSHNMFPSHFSSLCGSNCLEIRRFPLVSVLLIEFLKNGLFVPLPESDFEIDFGSPAHYPFIFPVDDWPTTDCVPRPVKIEIEVGYGFPDPGIPNGIKVGLLQHIAFLYQNRGDCACDGNKVSSLPAAAKLIYSKFIIYKLQNEWIC